MKLVSFAAMLVAASQAAENYYGRSGPQFNGFQGGQFQRTQYRQGLSSGGYRGDRGFDQRYGMPNLNKGESISKGGY